MSLSVRIAHLSGVEKRARGGGRRIGETNGVGREGWEGGEEGKQGEGEGTEALVKEGAFLWEACIPATVEMRKGDPGEVILKCSEAKQIDLIAMTTHGRSGPSRGVYGSVTTKVLRSTSIPLLVVRMSVQKEPEVKQTIGVDLI